MNTPEAVGAQGEFNQPPEAAIRTQLITEATALISIAVSLAESHSHQAAQGQPAGMAELILALANVHARVNNRLTAPDLTNQIDPPEYSAELTRLFYACHQWLSAANQAAANELSGNYSPPLPELQSEIAGFAYLSEWEILGLSLHSEVENTEVEPNRDVELASSGQRLLETLFTAVHGLSFMPVRVPEADGLFKVPVRTIENARVLSPSEEVLVRLHEYMVANGFGPRLSIELTQQFSLEGFLTQMADWLGEAEQYLSEITAAATEPQILLRRRAALMRRLFDQFVTPYLQLRGEEEVEQDKPDAQPRTSTTGASSREESSSASKLFNWFRNRFL